jgi:hypothetical protein
VGDFSILLHFVTPDPVVLLHPSVASVGLNHQHDNGTIIKQQLANIDTQRDFFKKKIT